ncbi:hypothetical protein [Mycobacteroides abscessus]|uniref:hypothetical protein n=1 Tax=Mycobacteroides abscessus TaxID=36809 RepID=UPI0009290D14|nr:hypothetical protein [Mycobacteroides abscessus]QSM87536.1 hypothetical protein I3U44_17045 [Mycobacteroides abscessus subsp. bolletii]SIC59063.1 Uncharacterised protein [Mycobacteroides abscessus subsp. abscessus]
MSTKQYRITLKMDDGFTNEAEGEDLPQLVTTTNALAAEHGGEDVHDYLDENGSIIYTHNGKTTGRADVTPVI